MSAEKFYCKLTGYKKEELSAGQMATIAKMEAYHKAELEKVKYALKQVLEMADFCYKHSLKNGSHQEFLKEDREYIAKVKGLLNKLKQ